MTRVCQKSAYTLHKPPNVGKYLMYSCRIAVCVYAYDYSFSITRGGSVLDLSGAKIWFTVKEHALDNDTDAKLQLVSDVSSEIQITNAAGGEFTVKFRGSGASQKNTSDLEGEWIYDIQVLLNDGTIITAAYGTIEFLKNITRATA